MKRLLVLMLCAALAIPAVGMNVQAEETVKTADQIAMENMSVLNDYIKNKKYTADEYKAADALMEKVAPELGLLYDKTTHKFTDDNT